MSRFEIIPLQWGSIKNVLSDCEIEPLEGDRVVALRVCLESGELFYMVGIMNAKKCHILTNACVDKERFLALLREDMLCCGSLDTEANVALHRCGEAREIYNEEAMKEALKIIIVQFTHLK